MEYLRMMRDDLISLFHALCMLTICSVLALLLYCVFYVESLTGHVMDEISITETVQSLLILLSLSICAEEAKKEREMINCFLLMVGFLGVLFIREFDFLLDNIHHGFWMWIALPWTFAFLIYPVFHFRETISQLAKMSRWKYFIIFIIGIVILLLYSRIIGSKYLWSVLVADFFENSRLYLFKAVIEETTETLGYTFIFASICLLPFNRGKWK